jgi:deoxyribodipyrimidine photo-lyase
MAPIHVIWFKRDLRTADHAPLQAAGRAAAQDGAFILPLYIAEPAWWAQPDMSARHWAFATDSLSELADDLAARGAPLIIRKGDAVEVLRDLNTKFGIAGLWSHEESGTAWTYDRDKAVARFARETGIPWHEYRQTGVIRRLKDRDGWARTWDRFMAQPIQDLSQTLPGQTAIAVDPIPSAQSLGLSDVPCPGRQQGGRSAAIEALDSFLTQRGERYQKEMSSPVSAETACSRISPHLAWGTLSMREAAQATWTRMAELRDAPGATGHWKASMRSFIGRLHWHCHFIQKFEDAPSIETEALHPAYSDLRGFDPVLHQAWAAGCTGWPFLDACMRSLHATGWINFRMRAMLMSASSYQLWNHWREPGLHLARLFTDYEPGIHWPQTQMQSGTTGINTARIYNPIKQGLDQDPDGAFIRRWVPELADVPTTAIHEPWTLSPLEQADLGVTIGRDYPFPVVDHMEAGRQARARIWSVRKGQPYREAAEEIQTRHGSRRSGLPATSRSRKRTTKPDVRQDSLDFG